MSQTIYTENIGESGRPFFWGHGWAQDLNSMRGLAQSLGNMGRHTLVDFPGFGKSPIPDEAWGTEDYADALADLIRSTTDEKIIWVGHSFGCRVGLQLAARHPNLIAGLCLIAGAGLPRKRSLWKRAYFKARIKTYKALKKLIPFGLPEAWLLKKFGSADYLSAGVMRPILTKVVNEDLSDVAREVTCPVLMIYGANDTETPPDIGERLHRILQNSELVVMDGHDHYSILSGAQHQVVHRINAFMKDIDKTP